MPSVDCDKLITVDIRADGGGYTIHSQRVTLAEALRRVLGHLQNESRDHAGYLPHEGCCIPAIEAVLKEVGDAKR